MYEGVDTVVLYEELAYQDVVPLQWRTLPTPLSTDAQTQLAERNARLLQACAALDEHGHTEKTDENSPHAADILRLDLKINLLLDLVGRLLVANQPRPAAQSLRFNAQGATWKMASPTCKPGDEGVLEIFLKDVLVEPLRMLGRVAAVSADGQIKVKFSAQSETIADLIEKLAFRKHRRQVAGSRQSRVDPSATGKFRR
jgi:Atypical PilZ domain, cyclic di-GMP receptor